MAVPALAERKRNLVVVGTSAGGVEALPRLLAQLPVNFSAAVLIVIHQPPRENPHLVHILQRACALAVTWAEQGEPFLPGHVYVGPPDTHLTVHDHHLRLVGGARENFARPSIDRLFRSAATHHGPQTIGVLLTGMMGDGVQGLVALRDSGGRTIVQEPADAAFAELPSRALATFQPDATLRLDDMGVALLRMTDENAPNKQPPAALVLEDEIDELGFASPRELDKLGHRVQQACPECSGPLWEVGTHEKKHWRCYLGHVVSARDLLDRSSEHLETALWNAIRALHERAATWESLALDAQALGGERVADDYATRAKDARDQADLARKFMLDVLRRR